MIDGLRWQEVFAGADPLLIETLADNPRVLEAARAEFWRDTPEERRETLLPFLWGVVAEQGLLAGNVWQGSEVDVLNGLNFSYPGYNEILSGYPDERIDSNAKEPNPNVTVLEWLNGRPGFEDRVAAFTSWDVFPYIINEERSGVLVNAGWEDLDDPPLTGRQRLLDELSATTPWTWDEVRYDGFTYYAALEHLKKHQPRVLFISFDAPDSRAHEGRYDLYLAAAQRFDRLVADLWKTIQSLDAYRGKTTLLLATDHGRGGGPDSWRGHGSNVDGAEKIWLAALGPDTPAHGVLENSPTLTQGQVAATLAAAVGEDYAGAVPEAAPVIPVVFRDPPTPAGIGATGTGAGPSGPGIGIDPGIGVAPSVPADTIAGIWQGVLRAPGGVELTIVFHIQQAEDGAFTATLDSPDQGARGIPIDEVTLSEHGAVRLTSSAVAGSYSGTLTEDRTRIEGTWSQGGGQLPLSVERVEAVEERRRPQDPEPPLPYLEEEVSYPNSSAEIELAGTLTLPEGPGPFPAVVLISGSGPQDRNETVFGHRPFLVIADMLTRDGIAVLRFDDRGVGGSTGNHAVATTADFVGDALAGVEYLKGRPEVDAGRIGLVGHSEGGVIAPAAAVESQDVAFIVLLAGTGITGEEILYRQGQLIARASGAADEAVQENLALQRELFAIVREEPDAAVAAARLRQAMEAATAELSEAERQAAGISDATISAEVQRVNSPWMRYFLTYDPAPTLERVGVPVLALNGELDLQVPPEVNLDAIAAALERGGNPDFTVRELPGLNHLFQEATTGSPGEYAGIDQTVSPEVMELVASWILERFGG
jgi:fermentation-respiration switch protein FrsA (DUF1100 family)